jgi:hypothetical protein
MLQIDKISKRQTITKSQFLNVLNIPGLLELVYEFLMDPISKDGYSVTNKNEGTWILLRQICRISMLWSSRLIDFLSPHLDSEEKLDAWTHMAPSLQHFQVYNFFKKRWTPKYISLLHLRSIIINNSETLVPNIIKHWNCPKLQHLELKNYSATELVIREINLAFPLLTYLSCKITGTPVIDDDNGEPLSNIEDTEFTISDFSNLIKFSFVANGTDQLHIVNMPSLTTCEFDDGNLDLLQFNKTPNLRHIIGTFDGGTQSVKKVVFCDPVPFLETFYLEWNPRLELIDPYNHVCWEKCEKTFHVLYQSRKNMVQTGSD